MSIIAEEESFWLALDSAVGTFCLKSSLEEKASECKIISEFVDSDWEWTGNQAFLGILHTLNELKNELMDSMESLRESESTGNKIRQQLNEEKTLNYNLKKQLRQNKLVIDDNSWALEEKNAQLKNEIELLQNRILELECCRHGDKIKQ